MLRSLGTVSTRTEERVVYGERNRQRRRRYIPRGTYTHVHRHGVNAIRTCGMYIARTGGLVESSSFGRVYLSGLLVSRGALNREIQHRGKLVCGADAVRERSARKERCVYICWTIGAWRRRETVTWHARKAQLFPRLSRFVPVQAATKFMGARIGAFPPAK